VLCFGVLAWAGDEGMSGDKGVSNDSGHEVSESESVASKKVQQDVKSDSDTNLKTDVSPVISKIEVKGLRTIKPNKVLAVIGSKRNRRCSNDIIREDVRSILALEYFDSVVPNFDNHSRILTFVVVEKPYVKRIVFKGNFEFSAGKLKRTSVLKEKKYYNVSDLGETNRKIFTLYRNRGYADCQIEVHPTVDAETNEMTVTFLITENNKIVVGGIKVAGDVSVKTKKILKLMKTKPKKAFKEEFFEADLEAVQVFYKNNGFMDYQFVSFGKTYNEARTEMFLTLNIVEGVRYKIGKIIWTGNSVLNGKQIRKLIKFKRGQLFCLSKIDDTKRGICAAYGDKGYLDVVVNCEFSKDRDDVVDVNLSIEENDISYVGNVNIDGLVYAKDKIIRREILLKPGDVLALNKVHRSIEKIYNLGFIEGVEKNILPTNASSVKDLSFSVTDAKPSIVSLGISYSIAHDATGSASFRGLNVFGTGLQAKVSGEYGKKRKNLELEVADPWIFGKNASLSLNWSINKTSKSYVYNEEKENKEGSKKNRKKEDEGYAINKNGFCLELSPRISDTVSFLLGYRFEKVTLNDVDKGAEEKAEKDESFSKHKNCCVTSIIAQIMYDSTDYNFDPSSGTKDFLRLQLASKLFGGCENFIKGTVGSAWYFPTFWRFVLGVNLRFGVIGAVVGDKWNSIPVYERFCVGGVDTIRGYKQETEIGPKNGGTVEAIANVEYKFPIVSYRGKTILQGLLFYDVGGAWKDLEHVRLDFSPGRKNLHHSVGLGIRIVSPMLVPLSIYCAHGFNSSRGESLDQFQFNIGFGF
jgi:outer membrane protein insertion porin family